ncbi:Uncharacterized protein Adt_32406 [Abeliophyllum distichum]|uniref:Uncharacterized protein n=1 Tax=Abeliophyllum distichum TaxID=126358 RepID=A0ABD1QTA8_9LAMI
MLVDDKSSVVIIYRATYDKLGIETHLIPAIVPSMGLLETLLFLGNYCLDDKGRLTLIDLGDVTHTKFLCMKFSTDRRVATVKENKYESRTCYTNAMKNFVNREVHVIDIEMGEVPADLKRIDVGPKEEDEHMRKLEDRDDLDPRVIEAEPQTSSTEKIECFPTHPIDLTKEQQVESDSSEDFKDQLTKFLSKNLDIFA